MPETSTYEVEWVDIDELTPHPENYRTHPDEQITEIRQSIRQFGIYKNIVTARDLTILAGHGVVKGARAEGYDEVPIYRVDVDPTSAFAKKLLVADNSLSLLAEDSDEDLASLLQQIEEEEGSLDATGYINDDLDSLLDNLGESPNGERDAKQYTQKIETPTYEPSDDPPALHELYDEEKAYELLKAIDKADLPEDVETFLRVAAYRHVEFRFDKIADFYAHAPPEVQQLMEDSALVIVDFDKAIEDGFVQLSETVREILSEHPEFNVQ